MQRQTSNNTNQWLRGPDGSLLSSVEGREVPTRSQMDGRMKDDSEVVTVDDAVGSHNSKNSGTRVVTVTQNMGNRVVNPISGITKDMVVFNTDYGKGGNLVLDKVEIIENNLNIGGNEVLDANDLNGLTFREQKRSRVDEPIQTGPKENNEYTDLEMAEQTNNAEEVSKNLFTAGTAMQTRQSL